MKDNSILLDGSQAQKFNELCREYNALKAEYEEITEKWTNIVNGIKAFNETNEKSVESVNFVVNFKVTGESMILDTKKIKELYPEIVEQCQKVRKGSASIMEVLKK